MCLVYTLNICNDANVQKILSFILDKFFCALKREEKIERSEDY